VSSSKQGWGWPLNSRKAHYFVDGIALCGSWMFLGSKLDDSSACSKDDCAACRRKLDKRKTMNAKDQEGTS